MPFNPDTLRHSGWRARSLVIFAALLLALAAACSSGSDEPIISEDQPLNGPEYAAVVVTTDMAVGANRIAFGIVDFEGMPVRADTSQVRAYYLVPRQEDREFKTTATANFVQWPVAVGGVFVVNLDLDTGGAWELEVDAVDPNASSFTAKASFIVKDVSSTTAIGAPAPASVTYTASEVDDLAQITSSPEPDPDLYQLSIHQALAAGKPLVVVFATPAFCVSATCGPQVGELSKVKDVLKGQANFIHVEVFEEPNKIEGGRPSEGLVTAVDEWGLQTEPWTFVVDSNGLVSAKFEQFTTAEEIEAALRKVL